MSTFGTRRILVTGAAGGIGQRIVEQLLEAGADVVAADRSMDVLETVRSFRDVALLPFDLASEESVEAALADLDLWGVVNCAGFGGLVQPMTHADIPTFDRVMAINARGALLVSKFAARSMIRLGKGGSIVNVSSQAALVGLEGHASYGASKAALDSITRVCALELGKYGIRVNSVNPTVVMTEMSASYWGRPEIGLPVLNQIPLGRWATESDVAAPVVFLLSDAAGMITGTCLPVDGGYTCR